MLYKLATEPRVTPAIDAKSERSVNQQHQHFQRNSTEATSATISLFNRKSIIVKRDFYINFYQVQNDTLSVSFFFYYFYINYI